MARDGGRRLNSVVIGVRLVRLESECYLYSNASVMLVTMITHVYMIVPCSQSPTVVPPENCTDLTVPSDAVTAAQSTGSQTNDDFSQRESIEHYDDATRWRRYRADEFRTATSFADLRRKRHSTRECRIP